MFLGCGLGSLAKRTAEVSRNRLCKCWERQFFVTKTPQESITAMPIDFNGRERGSCVADTRERP